MKSMSYWQSSLQRQSELGQTLWCTLGPGNGVLEADLGGGVGSTDFALHWSLAWGSLSCNRASA